MGCYVNPQDQTKEAFLAAEGRPVTQEEAGRTDFDSGAELPVVLVNNGAFKAAGVAYEREEFDAFAYPDGRSKQWFMVSRAKLFEVSDLAGYIA